MQTEPISQPPDQVPEKQDSDPWSFVPPVPQTIEATGIPQPFLRELVLKTTWAHDRPTIATMSEITGLHLAVVEQLVTNLAREGLCNIDSGSARDSMQFSYLLTEKGKVAAHEALDRSRYIGRAPVPVRAYNDMIEEQVKRFCRPPLDEIRKALAHMVLPERMVEVIGQAFFSRRALMIYGPSGNGKTDIVTSIARVVAGTVVIPYALYGHGQLIRVFDPDVHKSQVDNEARSEGIFADKALRHDRRWLPVHRPTVIVGGDMGAEALEMSYDATQGVHNAPLSVVAQGGVLVIDDLGRQKISPKEILNRWVLMMEQGCDSFALSSSEVVRLPLDVTLIFSTNLALHDLVDEAYMRRIAYKVAIPDPSRDQLAEITRRFCDQAGIEWEEDAIQRMMDRLYAPGATTPHGCFPRDIITTIMDEAEFRGRDPVLDEESMDAACALYLGTADFSSTEAA